MIDLTMHRGDDKIYELTVTDKQTGNAVDITGTTVTMTWKKKITDSSYFLQKVVTSHTDPTNGITEIAIDAADTSSLTEKTMFVFDVQIEKTTGKIETLIKGKITVLLDVT